MEVQESVALKCDEIIMGCLITNKSIQSKLDLLKESKRALLAGQQDTYATSRTKAMDRLVGYEAINRESQTQEVCGCLAWCAEPSFHIHQHLQMLALGRPAVVQCTDG